MAHAHLILDRYEPLGIAGSGGFGTVQIAWDPRIQRKVAIKTIQLTEQDAYRAALPGAQAVTAPAQQASTADRWHGVQPWNEFLEQADDADELADADETPETFHALANLPGLDEARTAAMLADQRIVTVYDFEVRGRIAYLIMEYVEGITLTSLLANYEDWLTLDVVAAVFDAVAGALTVAHENNVLHLDIKPDNILINAKGEVKVTDFGLATLADASGAGTTGGGTIGYMPLEQMRREHLDARADEWSLAAVTYEMLTGENPFWAKRLDEAELAIEEAELVLPSLCWQNMDEQLDDVIFYALDPNREDRYDSVRDFAEEVDKFLGNAQAGKNQLVDIVEDALGLNAPPEDEDDGEDEPVRQQGGHGFLKTLFAALGINSADESAPAPHVLVHKAEELPEVDDEPYYADETKPARKPRAPHTPIRERVGARGLAVASRAFAALASGFVTALAAWNFGLLAEFGAGRYPIVAALAIAAAVLAIVRPHIGALASFALFAVALAANGAIVPAIVLVVGLLVWWYFIARESDASSNVVLSLPLLGAVGGGSIVPLFAGATLRPLQAVATSAFAALVALMLAALGSGSLLGWDAATHWVFGGTDINASLISLVTNPATWCVFAGWVAAAFVQSLLSVRGRRWMEVVGLIMAVAVIAVSQLAFGQLSVQLIASLAAGAACILAVIL